MLTIKEIREIAVKAHDGQSDFDGVSPHMEHVDEVAEYFDGWSDHAVALLHDVIEDNEQYSGKVLLELGVPPHVVKSVEVLTRRKLPDGSKEPYFDYILRIRDSEDEQAKRIKPRDVFVNWRRSKLGGQVSLAGRYEKAADILGFKLGTL